jgi:hypothetical protein
VRWSTLAIQLAIGAALIAVGALGLYGEAGRQHLHRVAQATWVAATRPTIPDIDSALARGAWNHTSLAASRDVLAASAWLATYRAAELRRTGPAEAATAADALARDRLNGLIGDGPSNPLAWYFVAEQLLATSGYSRDVESALRLSYVTGRYDLRAAERRVGLLLRYWPILRENFVNELRSDVRVMAYGASYDWVNSRLAHIAYFEAPAQAQFLRQTLGEIQPQYLYWFDWETEQIKKAAAKRK